MFLELPFVGTLLGSGKTVVYKFLIEDKLAFDYKICALSHVPEMSSSLNLISRSLSYFLCLKASNSSPFTTGLLND